MKRIIIADLKSNNNNGICTGHYYALAENYRDVFSPFCEVKIASGPIYLKRFKKEEMLLLPYDYIAGESKIKNLIRIFFNARFLFKHVGKDDVVIVQQSQPAMILLVLLFTFFGQCKLFQIQYSEEPMRRFSFKVMMFFARKKIKGLICPNEIVGNAYRLPYIVVPDYIYVEKETNKPRIAYSEKVYDFAFVGRIAKDKGVAEAVKAMGGKSYTLLVAGLPQNQEEENSLKDTAAKCSNIKLKLEYVDDDDYDNYINNSRYCVLNYQGTYVERSSGVVLDTIFRGVPIVGRKCRALQFVEDENLGFLYDDINEYNFSDLLNENKYASYLFSIDAYKLKFKKYRMKLVEYVMDVPNALV